ncbi:Glycosyl transferases group 1 [Candidatus Kryptobacter tengchongensis]|nr:Glycosyl transferases group 1 [Candidatus Kryptobacter tengchongensis]CUU05906.1 Glycosyl transferases group 1 [Candidatus Kryptobacter tengchongensis]
MIRKVLMITYHFPPVIYGSSFRAFNFAKHLKDYNWFSSILTLNHSIFPALKDFTLTEALKESNVKVYAVNLIKPFSKIASLNFPKTKKELIPKILLYTAKIFGVVEPEDIWKFKAIKFGEKILKSERYNAIIAFVPPLSTVQIGAHLSKKFKIPLIIDYSSIIPQKKSLTLREKKLLRAGSSVIVDNRRIKDYLLQNYLFLDYNFVKIIPTGFNLSEFTDHRINPDDKFTLTLAYGKITLKKFKLILNALAYLSRKDPLFKKSLLFNLIGIPTNEIVNLISKLQIKENIKIYQNLQRENYIKILLSSNFLIYLDDFDISNVPYDYIATGKPYIAIINGQNNHRYIIGDYKNSLIADANDPSSIVNAFIKAFELYLNQKVLVPKLNLENYDIKKVIINLVRELELFTPD